MKQKLLALATFALVALLVAACGGDDDDKASVTNSPASTATSDGGGDDDTTTVTATPEETEDSGDGGDDGGDGDTALGFEACDILTEAQVGDVMERPVTINIDNSYDTSCTYDGAADVGLAVITTFRHGTHQDMQDYFDLPIGEETPVDGVGDEAQWAEGLGVFEVVQGEYGYDIQIIDILGPETADPLAQAKQLASIISGELP